MGYQLRHMKMVITSSGFLTNNQIIRNLVFAIFWVSLSWSNLGPMIAHNYTIYIYTYRIIVLVLGDDIHDRTRSTYLPDLPW